MTSIHDKIVRRIRLRGKKKGWVFGPKDFFDLGNRTAIDKTLSRLVQDKMIRRVMRGVYHYPKYFELIGDYLSADSDDIARVIVAKSGDRIMPSGATSANILGFSTQVPLKTVYFINGRSRKIKIGDRYIVLKHAAVPIVDKISFTANVALQALSYMGKDSVNDKIIRICATKLNARDIKSLSSVNHLVPYWMVKAISKIQSVANG